MHDELFQVNSHPRIVWEFSSWVESDHSSLYEV